ncbi:hypothetical protein [Nitritalea halalkaliphila]|uniref:hypothetical protein n=1 Tax=Nitritalea halalkaliphila TaxID=590849 RepID=UPI001EE66B8E|nr:hypothetical protein [Nitritalea halalkaliphila]
MNKKLRFVAGMAAAGLLVTGGYLVGRQQAALTIDTLREAAQVIDLDFEAASWIACWGMWRLIGLLMGVCVRKNWIIRWRQRSILIHFHMVLRPLRPLLSRTGVCLTQLRWPCPSGRWT